MFNTAAATELRVKQTFFRNIFGTQYNIGFGSPRTDCCSTCIAVTEKINVATGQEKQNLMAKKRIRSLRAKAFYTKLNECRDDMITFAFDCQKNLVLPKVPYQSTYYSRQLYLYNFTMVRCIADQKLNMSNVFSYVWREDQAPKNSSVIASAVHHRLQNTDFNDDVTVTTVRLVADGCGGQNKNETMLGMVCKWLHDETPSHVSHVELVFPMTGHSFLPPDRVFGNIERALKKNDTLIFTEEYVEIISQFASVLEIDNTWVPENWKEEVAKVLKTPQGLHFRITECKRFLIRKQLQGSVLQIAVLQASVFTLAMHVLP